MKCYNILKILYRWSQIKSTGNEKVHSKWTRVYNASSVQAVDNHHKQTCGEQCYHMLFLVLRIWLHHTFACDGCLLDFRDSIRESPGGLVWSSFGNLPHEKVILLYLYVSAVNIHVVAILLPNVPYLELCYHILCWPSCQLACIDRLRQLHLIICEELTESYLTVHVWSKENVPSIH